MPEPRAAKHVLDGPTSRAFWTYLDAEGHQHIVDTFEDIPEALRSAAKRLDPEQKDETTPAGVEHGTSEPAPIPSGGFVDALHLPSMAIGGALGLTVALVFAFVQRSGRTLFKVALVVAIVGCLSSAYLGWLRSAAGLGPSTLTTPGSLIRDARDAADKMRGKLDETEETLERIEEGSK